MTRLIRRTFVVLALLLLFYLGLVIASEFAPFLGRWVTGIGVLPPLSRLALALLLLLLPLFIAALVAQESSRDLILKAKAKDGDDIRLTETALRRCLRHEIRSIPEVAGVASRAANGQTGPRVVLRVLIWAGSDVPAVQKRIKERTLSTLRNLFGIGEIENIQVIVEGLVFAKGSRRAKAR